MTEAEKEVLSKITNYNYYKAVKEELEGQLESIVCNITASYGDLAGCSGKTTNKVEKMAIKRDNLKEKIQALEAKLEEIKSMIDKSGLDPTEKEVLWWAANNGKLAAYARRERIGKDNVYKIRDRAITKIANHET